jgi:NAD(P)-dependent dehydrogenase (short-subunit alcohol dehydrogenase family)
VARKLKNVGSDSFDWGSQGLPVKLLTMNTLDRHYSVLKGKTVLITGANRGLGWGVAHALGAAQIPLVLAARDLEQLEAKVRAAHLQEQTQVHCVPLDISSSESVRLAAQGLHAQKIEIHAILNNAGVFTALPKKPRSSEPRGDEVPSHHLTYSADDINATLNINATGAYRVAQEFVDGMVARKWGRIVNVSSGMGGLTEMEGGFLNYRISKTAMNAITRVLHADLHQYGILTNSVCPGWVKTDMGGKDADRSVDEGIQGLLWALSLPDHGPSGGFFHDGEPLDW